MPPRTARRPVALAPRQDAVSVPSGSVTSGSSEASVDASSTGGDGTRVSGGWGEFDPDSDWGTPKWEGWGSAGWDAPDTPSRDQVDAPVAQTTNAVWATAGAAAAGTILAILALGIVIRVVSIFL